ncbi:MAG TPA: aryl-sulfate sulfotransferase [Acidimicrobiia bacterium]
MAATLTLAAACSDDRGTDTARASEGTAAGGGEVVLDENGLDRGLPAGLVSSADGTFGGYTLYSPLTQETTYLVDIEGNVVHEWQHETQPGLYQYLEESGNLLRTGRARIPSRINGNGFGGVVEELDWDGNVVWSFEYGNDDVMQHHDIERLPNGNVLILAWEYYSADEAIAAGRDPELLPDDAVWADHVVEYDPNADAIVWEWRVWDHLVQDFDETKENFGDVAENPQKIDINYSPDQSLQEPGEADWNHANSVAYNAELDQIAISLRSFDEFWVIDHGTTTEEAAGPAGDLLFRYGNPATYGKEDVADQELYAQHDVEWIEDGFDGAGNLLVFNNGRPDLRAYSSVDEVVPVMEDGEYVLDDDGAFAAAIERVYPQGEEDEFFAAIISGSQRLPNGNTLVTYGTHGRVVEVTPDGEEVWDYINPYFTLRPQTPRGNLNFELQPWRIFRAERYPEDYPAFEGRDLTPLEPAG